MFNWILENRLFQLAREGKRLTPWWAALPIGSLILLLSWVFSLPVVLAYGIYSGEHWATLSEQPSFVSGMWQVLLLITSFGGVILLTWLWIRLYERRAFHTLGFEYGNILQRYGRGLLIGLLMFSGAVGLMAIFGFLASETSASGHQGLLALGGVLIVLPGWVVQGAAEEVLIRGWMMPVLGARYRPWIGVILSSVFFAVMHGLNPNLSILALVNLFLYGLFAALYALRDGSLWGICALHSVWNWAQGNIFGLEVSGSETGSGTLLNLMEAGPDWFTGGDFGPEGGLAVSLVLLCGIAVVLLMKARSKAACSKSL
jgi:membrane protease YdiL (CAAX protease family)